MNSNNLQNHSGFGIFNWIKRWSKNRGGGYGCEGEGVEESQCVYKECEKDRAAEQSTYIDDPLSDSEWHKGDDAGLYTVWQWSCSQSSSWCRKSSIKSSRDCSPFRAAVLCSQLPFSLGRVNTKSLSSEQRYLTSSEFPLLILLKSTVKIICRESWMPHYRKKDLVMDFLLFHWIHFSL